MNADGTPLLSDALAQELSAILLLQAHQIEMCSGLEQAESFIGFRRWPMVGSFCSIDPKRVDLRRFSIAKLFAAAETFVTQPCPQSFMTAEVQHLKHFMQGISRFNAYHELGGAVLNVADFNSRCRDIADTAYARWKLEVNRKGPFSIRELSLLSGISVQDIRRGLKDKPGEITGASCSKSAKIGLAEAKRWLFTQDSFKSSWSCLKDDPYVTEALSAVKSPESLIHFVKHHRWMFARIVDPALQGFPGAQLVALQGDAIYTPERAADLAKRLDLDVPLFVGKVVEASMRLGERKR